MKNIFKYSKDRSYFTNVMCSIISFLLLFVISGLVKILLSTIIKNTIIVGLITNILLIVLLVLLYYKDLKRELLIYKNKFKDNFSHSFNIYLIGFMGMIFINVIINLLLHNVSSNEEQVREMLFNNVITSMISISIFAPISEELIFRKSLQPIIKNKWLYVIISGLLFGFAHIMTNITSGNFVLTDLIYILPYASLGSSFALMDHDTKTTFSSIVIHSMHNTLTALTLVLIHAGGMI